MPAARLGARALVLGSLLFSSILPYSSDAPAAPPNVPVVQKASDLFDQAMQDWEQGRRHKALQEFRDSFVLVPEAATLWNIVGVQVELHAIAGAYRDLGRYLARFEGSLLTRRLHDATELRDELEKQLARVHLTLTPPDAKIQVDGEPVEHPDVVWLDAGNHVLRAEAPGHRPMMITVPLEPGERRDVSMDLLGAAEVDPAQRKVGLVFLSAGVAGLVTGGILVGLALERKLRCPDSTMGAPICKTDADVAAYAEAGGLAAAANLPLAFGAILGGVGLHLTLTASRTNQDPVVRTLAFRAGPVRGGAGFALTATW